MKLEDVLLYGGLAFVGYKLFLEPKKQPIQLPNNYNPVQTYNPYNTGTQGNNAAAIITAGTPLITDVLKYIWGNGSGGSGNVSDFVPVYGSGYDLSQAGNGTYLAGIEELYK